MRVNASHSAWDPNFNCIITPFDFTSRVGDYPLDHPEAESLGPCSQHFPVRNDAAFDFNGKMRSGSSTGCDDWPIRVLYRRPGASGLIDFSELIARLCSYLSSALGTEIICNTGGVMVMKADEALNLGIAVNELITNAVKHSNAPVVVSCGRAGTHFTIKVEGGIIADEEVLRAKRGRFGLRMVERVVADAGGEIDRLDNAVELRVPS